MKKNPETTIYAASDYSDPLQRANDLWAFFIMAIAEHRLDDVLEVAPDLLDCIGPGKFNPNYTDPRTGELLSRETIKEWVRGYM